MYHMNVLVYTIVFIRAGWYLGILVITWYWNQMIHVSSKFQWNDIITFDIITVLAYLKLL